MSTSRTAEFGAAAARTAEGSRLEEIRHGVHWRRWGPYLSERQWGTVREDYSENGDAWGYFPHDHARSRAYRWGEDGLGGFGDDQLLLCLGLALWNGRDPILKERLFGLTNAEGNHGEDVKELYYHLDGTPTHSYMRMLYKYPQAAFPYARLVEENRRRDRTEPEFELIDTGVFDGNRYFDVVIEYAKADVDDILMQVTIHNRAAEAASLHVLPQLWARNIWSWKSDSMRPQLLARQDDSISIDHPQLPELRLHCDGRPEFLFCQNETNIRRLCGIEAPGHHFKDGINDYVVNGDTEAVRPDRRGTKVAAHYQLSLPGAESGRLRARLTLADHPTGLDDFDRVFDQRRAEADEFYAELQQDIADPDARLVQRQALAGMLWNKQYYYIDIPEWLNGDPLQPPPPAARRHGRNSDWPHLNNADIILMPDKWEYPWYAAWDLAFHAVTIALIDPRLAKNQLLLLTRDWYMHPNGQLPAYEWAFGDVNPPVQAWAAWRVYEIDRDHRGGEGDRDFLERVFHKLMLNFTWWVNRKDVEGRNIFQGGFLGLDNIGLFDRNAALPSGGYINQADGTAWMAMYTLNLMRIALELALTDHVYEDIASKFFEHFLYIAEAMTNIGGEGIGLWDEEDEFYYDVVHLPGGERIPSRVRSLVGLIPLFAVEPAQPDARRDRIPIRLWGPFAVQILWRKSLRARACRPPLRGPLCSGGFGFGRLRRQFQLARPDLDAGKLFDHRILAKVSQLLRRRFQGRVSDRLRQALPSRRGGRRAFPPSVPDLSARRERTQAGAGRLADRAGGHPFPRQCTVLRIFSRRHRPRPRRLASDRVDRSDCTVAALLRHRCGAHGSAGSHRPRSCPCGVTHKRIGTQELHRRRACFETRPWALLSMR